MEAPPLFRRCNTARGSIEQANTESRLELTNGLTQRRSRYPEVIRGAREARPVDNRNERLQLGKLGSAHCVLITELLAQIVGDYLIGENRSSCSHRLTMETE